MTPTLCWVFLLALVGRATSMPQPLVVDACALICNPGAETESERERDPSLYPRYPKVNCKLQSDSEEHQAWVIASHCLKLCNRELTVSSEVNCFALRSSLGASLGCYCEALTPLSPNTMRLHETWRLNFLVKELANDILTTIADSPLDKLILCELHQELFSDVQLKKTENGKLVECYQNGTAVPQDTPQADTPESLPKPEGLFMKESEDWKDDLLQTSTDTLEKMLLPKEEEEEKEIDLEEIKRPRRHHHGEKHHRHEHHRHKRETMKDEIGHIDIEEEEDEEEAIRKESSQAKVQEREGFGRLCMICNAYCQSDVKDDKDDLGMFCNCDLVKQRCNN